MKNIKLFIFDIDNTLTTGPSIWEIMHEACGTWETHGKKYWDDFLANKFDFDTFAKLDVACWKDLPEKILWDAIEKVNLTTGFSELAKVLNQKKIPMVIVSGTVGQFAEKLQKQFGFAKVYANPLGITNGQLDGTIEIQVPGEGKGPIVEEIVKTYGLHKEEIAVAGDSHFDLPMFEHAGHSIIVNNHKYKDHGRYFIKDFREILELI